MARRILPVSDDSAVAIVALAATLPFPPTAIGFIPDAWKATHGHVAEADLAIWAPATCNLTNAELYAGILHAFAQADDDVDTVDFANDELDLTGHAYATGDGPLRLTTTDTLPTGLELATDYWAIYVGANTIQLAASLEDALEGTAVEFDDVGVGTHTISDVATTQRLFWHSMGLLGHAADGAIGLTAIKARVETITLVPAARAYAISATISASTPSAALYPRVSL